MSPGPGEVPRPPRAARAGADVPDGARRVPGGVCHPSGTARSQSPRERSRRPPRAPRESIRASPGRRLARDDGRPRASERTPPSSRTRHTCSKATPRFGSAPPRAPRATSENPSRGRSAADAREPKGVDASGPPRARTPCAPSPSIKFHSERPLTPGLAAPARPRRPSCYPRNPVIPFKRSPKGAIAPHRPVRAPAGIPKVSAFQRTHPSAKRAPWRRARAASGNPKPLMPPAGLIGMNSYLTSIQVPARRVKVK